jgi:hypothetical protein
MINQKTSKQLLFGSVSAVAFFGVSFFIIGSIFTGLGSFTYDYSWFFKNSYAIHPSFVLVIAVISVAWTLTLIKIIIRFGIRLKTKKAIFCCIQILFSVTVIFLAISKGIAYDGWWPYIIDMLGGCLTCT